MGYVRAFVVAVLAVLLGAVAYLIQTESQDAHGFKHIPLKDKSPVYIEGDTFTRKTYTFSVEGNLLEGWLYLPRAATSITMLPPLILMAHGLAAQKDFGLEAYAKVFTAEGFAVFSFDYRTFGGSDGEPRNWVDSWRHVEDWRGAIDFLVTDKEIAQVADASRLGLWGSSLSGGHVIVTAATTSHQSKIKAVVSQTPFLDPAATLKDLNPLNVLKVLTFGFTERLTSLLGFSPRYFRLVGTPDQMAWMNTPEAHPGYWSFVPKNPAGGWQNKVVGRSASTLNYRPIEYADKVKAPIMVIGAEKDTLCPVSSVEEAAKKMPHSEYHQYADNHFAIYAGPVFDKYVNLEAEFYRKHL